jgi:hypothetical protein
MAEIDDELDSVKKAIEAAFADARFPGSRPEDLVQYTIPPERERLAPLFAGKRWEDWKDRPMEMFNPHKFSGGLIFLEPEAFRYYLPVFLLAGLSQPEEAGNVLSETIHLLSRADSDSGKVWCSMMLEEMTQPQLLATIGALDYFDGKYGSFNPAFHNEIERARASLRSFLRPRE